MARNSTACCAELEHFGGRAEGGALRTAISCSMRGLLAACCLATLLAMAASEQQPPWEHDDSGQEQQQPRPSAPPSAHGDSGQEWQRPRPRPKGRKASPVVRDMRPAVQRWARPANVANGALLLVSGLPVAMRGGIMNLQPIGLLLGGWVRFADLQPCTAASPSMRPTRNTAPNPEHRA